MRWSRHMAHTRKTKNAYNALSEELKKRQHLEDLVAESDMILKRIFRKQGWRLSH